MIDKLLAILSLALLAGFLGIIAFRVPQAPLIVIFIGVLCMAAFDFWRELKNTNAAPRR